MNTQELMLTTEPNADWPKDLQVETTNDFRVGLSAFSALGVDRAVLRIWM